MYCVTSRFDKGSLFRHMILVEEKIYEMCGLFFPFRFRSEPVQFDLYQVNNIFSFLFISKTGLLQMFSQNNIFVFFVFEHVF